MLDPFNRMNEQQNTTQNTEYAGYSMSQGVLQLRLETQPIIDQIELFLKGEKLVIRENKEGEIQTQVLKIGERKSNDIGIQSIVGYVANIINSQTVQGNFKSEQYDKLIEEIHIELFKYILDNQYEWEMKTKEIAGILGSIIKLILAFLSRPINNKERDSYGTIKYTESNTSNATQSSSGIGFLRGGN